MSRQTLRALAFERGYAERSGISVERLRLLGRVVAPCHCGHSGCEGYQSLSREAMETDRPLGRVPPGWTWPPDVIDPAVRAGGIHVH
jgi:hypothetical protein